MISARLGQLHAWRDRGNVYVDGIRTSAQASLLAAGVAKGADFAGTAWAVALGLGLFVALEGGKILAGYLDYRFRVMHEYQKIASEANPVTMRQVAALERLAPPAYLRGNYDIPWCGLVGVIDERGVRVEQREGP